MKIDAAFRSRLKKKLLAELKSDHVREVVVKSVVPLSSMQLNALQDALPALNGTELSNEIDASLIGGLVIVDGSKIIDMSIKGSMQDLVSTLI